MIFNSISIKNRLQDIEDSLEEILNRLEGLPIDVKADELKVAFAMCSSSFKEFNEDIKKNISRLDNMTNELKGVVSMSRAAFNEGKSFTEMLELPRLLRAFSAEFCTFSDTMRKMEKLIDRQGYCCNDR